MKVFAICFLIVAFVAAIMANPVENQDNQGADVINAVDGAEPGQGRFFFEYFYSDSSSHEHHHHHHRTTTCAPVPS